MQEEKNYPDKPEPPIDERTDNRFKAKKVVKLSLVVLVFVLTLITSYLMFQGNLKMNIRGKATVTSGVHPKFLSSPTVKDFEVPYKNILDIYTNPAVINSFGGGLMLQEFWSAKSPNNPNDWPYWMAGHLGPFFSPMYYSDWPDTATITAADGTPTTLNLDNPNKGFQTGLVLFDQNTKRSVYEIYADHTKTKTLWSPAKMVVENSYPNFAGGVIIRGVKAALPDTRGFALKVQVTNTSTSPDNLSLMLLAAIPQMGIKNQWVWDNKPMAAGDFDIKHFDLESINVANNYTIVGSKNVSDPNKNVYLLLAVKGPEYTWENTDFTSRTGSINAFNTSGLLSNFNKDTSGNQNGSSVSFAFQLPQLGVNQTSGFTLYGFVGGSVKEVTDAWMANSEIADLEQYVDGRANSKIAQLFTNRLPLFSSGDINLNRVYYASAIQYLLNKWTNLSWYAGVNFRSRSLGMFPWTTGTEMILTQSDPAFWKNMILNQMKLDLTSCNAISPFGNMYCQASYAHTPFSLVRQLYEYTALTSDRTLLTSAAPKFNQNVLDQLAMYINQVDAKTVNPTIVVGSSNIPSDQAVIDGSKQIADFGGDANLYEQTFNGCVMDTSLGGTVYKGMVPVPNAERYMAHQMLAKLYGFAGDAAKANLHNSLAENIRAFFSNSFWDSQTSWLGVVSNKQSPQINRKVFYFEPIFNAIGYDGLLSGEQISQMVNSNLTKFVGPYGLYATSGGNNDGKSSSKCSRPDWQGPGLYTGQIGLTINQLLQNNFTNEAYSILSKYTSYLNQVPVIAWMYDATRIFNQTRYDSYQEFETPALAEAVIRGMMGLDPSTGGTPQDNVTWIKPRIPDALLQKGEVVFNGAFSQGHLWSLKANSQNFQIFVTPSYQGIAVTKTRLAVDVLKPTTITVNNLVLGNYTIAFDDQANIVSNVSTVGDAITFPVPVGRRVIFIYQTKSIVPTTTPTPSLVSSPTPISQPAPEMYPVATCTSWPNVFSEIPLSNWWGNLPTQPPTDKIDAYTNRVWKGNVQELVFSGGNVYVRTGSGKENSSLAGKPWLVQPLNTNWQGQTNVPPTKVLKAAAYSVYNGKYLEQIISSNSKYSRQTITAGQYDMNQTWTSAPHSKWTIPATCTVYPSNVTAYTRRVLNNESWELVGQGGDLYYRKAAGVDASVLDSACFTKITFQSAWPVQNIPTFSPSIFGYQLVANGKIREIIIFNQKYYYRDCQ